MGSKISLLVQGCYISREICFLPGWRETLGNTKKYGKYWEIQNFIYRNELLVGPVVGVLTCWKLIKLGTKTH